MKVIDIDDQIYWYQVWDVGDGFGDFGHHHQ